MTQEELQDVIVLLTSQNSTQTPVPLPGVTLTRVNDSTDNSRISSHRGSWWSEGEELDPSILMSRKSSSSTDTSSSCYSLHSRSTSTSEEGGCMGGGARSHLYSMWSGAELPFIKLPESTESNDLWIFSAWGTGCHRDVGSLAEINVVDPLWICPWMDFSRPGSDQ